MSFIVKIVESVVSWCGFNEIHVQVYVFISLDWKEDSKYYYKIQNGFETKQDQI